ncbi:MAG: AmmeMemoRadiSam system protein A [Candidatus Woesearchaeota archaeon]
MNLTKNQKSILLNLAKESIKSEFNKEINIDFPKFELAHKKRGCFVTIYKENQLRGCIGNIVPKKELFKSIIENAKKSAFNDPRFPNLRENEIKSLRLEISILSEPKEIFYGNKDEILVNITPLKDGIIIKKGYNSATYLPQVWKHFYDESNKSYNKKEFLNQLCQKANLNKEDWKKHNVTILKYSATVFSE